MFVDAAVLMLLMTMFGAGLYLGRVGSFLCAATFTWWLNRSITFRGLHSGSMVEQWVRFLGVNAVGGLVNFGVYALLVSQVATAARFPVIGIAAGSLCGLGFNFVFSRALVFRAG